MAAQILEFQINPQSALKALGQINAGLQDSEGKATKTGASLQGAFEKVTDTLIKLTDRQYAASERLVKSIEAQAAAYSKTGADKLIAQRDQIIKRLGDEEGQINRVKAAYDKLIAAQNGGSGSKFKEFGDSIKTFIEQPMQGAGTAITSLLEKMGPAGIVFASVATAGVAVGAALFEMSKGAAEAAQGIVNLSAQTGVSVSQLDKWVAMGKIVGVDMSSLARAGQTIAETLDEGGEKSDILTGALGRLHVQITDGNGGWKEQGELITEAIINLSHMQAGQERNALAAEVLGARVSKSMEPVLDSYEKTQQLVESLGYGIDSQIKKADGWAEMLHTVGLAWDQLGRSAAAYFESSIKYESEGGDGKIGKAIRWYQDTDAEVTAFENKDNLTYHWKPGPARTPGFSLDDLQNQLQTQAMNQGRNARTAIDLKYGSAIDNKKAELSEAEKQASSMVRGGAVLDPVAYDKAKAAVKGLKDEIQALEDAANKAKEAKRQELEWESKANDREVVTGRFENLPFNLKESRNLFAPNSDQVNLWDAQFKDQYQAQIARVQGGEQSALGNAKLSGVGGKQNQYDALNQEYQIKVQFADQLYNLERQHAIDDGEQVGKMDIEHENTLHALKQTNQLALADLYYSTMKESQDKLAEKQKQEIEEQQHILEQSHEEVSKTASSLFGSLLKKNPGQNFTKEIQSLATKQTTNLFGNFVADTLVPGGNKTQNELAKAGLDINTQATQMNTAATFTLAQTIAASMGSSISVPPSVSVGGGGAASVSVPTVSAPNIPIGLPSFNGGLPSFFGGFGGGASGGSSAGPSSGGYSLAFPSLDTTTGNYSSGPSFGYSGSGVGSGYSFPSKGGGSGFSVPFLGSLFGKGGFGSSGSPGGTSGFAGPVGGGSGRFKLPANLKSFGGLWSPATGTGNPGTYTESTDEYGNTVDTPGTAGSFNVQGAESLGSSAALGVGTSLLTKGLGGNNRGTGLGVAESAGGGALTGASIGFQVGGPIGAGFGAVIGAVGGAIAGTVELATGDISPQTKVKRQVKQKYGLTIPNQEANKIVSIAQSQFGGNVSLAVASPEVRQMLGLYAAGTGQRGNASLLASTPHAAGLTEQGGSLYQTQESIFGQAYSFKSGIPVLGGNTGNVYSAPSGYNGSSQVNLSLNVDSSSTSDFLNGQVVTADNISNAYMQNRVQNSALMNQPGLLT